MPMNMLEQRSRLVRQQIAKATGIPPSLLKSVTYGKEITGQSEHEVLVKIGMKPPVVANPSL